MEYGRGYLGRQAAGPTVARFNSFPFPQDDHRQPCHHGGVSIRRRSEIPFPGPQQPYRPKRSRPDLCLRQPRELNRRGFDLMGSVASQAYNGVTVKTAPFGER